MEKFGTNLAYRFFFLAAIADLVCLATIRPAGRFDLAIDFFCPRMGPPIPCAGLQLGPQQNPPTSQAGTETFHARSSGVASQCISVRLIMISFDFKLLRVAA